MTDSKIKLDTLIRLISFVKFNCTDYESRYFAGSPIVGEILSELKIQLDSNKDIDFKVQLDTPFGRTLIKSLKWHLEQTHECESMEFDSRFEHIVNLASPYILEKDFILSILKERDSYHGDSIN